MAFKANRVEEYIFSVGSLTADSAGLYDTYSAQSINGTIHSISTGSNTHTNTGSLMLFASGTDNGVNNKDLILVLRAGSKIDTFYPFQVGCNSLGIKTDAGSINYTQSIINGPLRLVGSGLGNGTSGTTFVVRYI
jgi:hypothetical protein